MDSSTPPAPTEPVGLEALAGLRGKVILVIGGGQGMGESASLLLAAAGADIAVVDRDGTLAADIESRIRASGRRSVSITADVTDDAALGSAIDVAERELGAIDGMLTIVGMAGWGALLDITADDWDRSLDINLRYVFVAAQEVARRMVARGAPGSLVFVASVDGIRSAPHHAAYGAAKAGLINLVKSMAAEWSQYGIRANAIAPGAIVTPRIPRRPEAEELALLGGVPARRRGETLDIAKAALFFISDLSGYVTGQTLAVDGGLTAVGPIDYGSEARKLGAPETRSDG